MATKLSDIPGSNILNGLGPVFVPFSCWVKIDPIHGKRQEVIRDMQKKAEFVEDALDTLCGASDGTGDDLAFDYTKPISFIPQFGQKTARLSFVGNACRRDSFTKTPVGERTVVNANEFETGPGASNASNRIPDAEVDALCKSLKASIEAAISPLIVIRLEIAGYIYGVSGSTFPL